MEFSWPKKLVPSRPTEERELFIVGCSAEPQFQQPRGSETHSVRIRMKINKKCWVLLFKALYTIISGTRKCGAVEPQSFTWLTSQRKLIAPDLAFVIQSREKVINYIFMVQFWKYWNISKIWRVTLVQTQKKVLCPIGDVYK